jgi:hypothetical protein
MTPNCLELSVATRAGSWLWTSNTERKSISKDLEGSGLNDYEHDCDHVAGCDRRQAGSVFLVFAASNLIRFVIDEPVVRNISQYFNDREWRD